MIIPKNETIIRKKGEKFAVFIFGEPMAGKTYAANTFPNTLNLNTDNNVQDINKEVVSLLETQKVTIGEQTGNATKWDLFKAYGIKFKDEEFVKQIKEAGFETIVVDVLDHLYDWCREKWLDFKGLNDESEDNFWAVANDIKKDFRDTIVRFLEAVKPHFNVVLIGFSDVEEYMEGVDKKTRRVPSLKVKLENSKGQDKHKVIEALTSRLDMFGGIFMTNIPQKDGLVEEVRIFYPLANKSFWGGNRIGIDTPIIPTYNAIQEAIAKNEQGE